MLARHSMCKGSVTTMVNCLHYRLPSVGEGTQSCLAGGPLAQQVQHVAFWVSALVSLNGFQDLVLHAEEGTKVPPFCIQPVSICMHLCILPCTFHPHPLHPHGCLRAVFIMPWPVYHVLLTTAVNTH